MALDYQHAAMHALQENGFVPIDGKYPVEVSVEESIGLAFAYATLAVAERLDALVGFLEDRAVTVRSE